MAEYPNSAILNANKYKKAGTKQPDLKGTAATTCVHCEKETEFELAGWKSEKFITLKFTEKSEAERKRNEAKAKRAGLPTESEAPQADVSTGEPDGQEIPF